MKHLFSTVFFLLVWGGALSGSPVNAASLPNVVVTIKPIHSLVAGVMAGVAKPNLLIREAGSPHGHVFRPSEARMLHKADLVVWVGPTLESFLVRPLESNNKRTQVLTLAEKLRESLLPARHGGDWEKSDHSHGGHHNHNHNHNHNDSHDQKASLSSIPLENFDPHLWLSPSVAKQMVNEITAALIQIDPNHSAIYSKNQQRLQADLDKLISNLRKELETVHKIPYLVFHDAYQYFENEFNLYAVGSVQLDPERTPSVRRVVEMKKKINRTKACAVFSEPQFESRLVQTIIEGTAASTGTLDPIGQKLPPGKKLYFNLINALSVNLNSTLKSCATKKNQAMIKP